MDVAVELRMKKRIVVELRMKIVDFNLRNHDAGRNHESDYEYKSYRKMQEKLCKVRSTVDVAVEVRMKKKKVVELRMRIVDFNLRNHDA